MELMKPVDGNMWASVYMWKPQGGKLQFGPMWDFDLAAGSANRAGGTVNSSGWYLRNQITTTAKQSTKTWFNRLNEDSSFRSAVSDRWDDVKGQLDDSDSFLSAESGKIKDSATRELQEVERHREAQQRAGRQGLLVGRGQLPAQLVEGSDQLDERQPLSQDSLCSLTAVPGRIARAPLFLAEGSAADLRPVGVVAECWHRLS